MSSLAGFWRKNKKKIEKGLKGGIQELAGVLQSGAADFDLVQKVMGETIQWTTQAGKLQILFCLVPDPRDLDRILEVFESARENQPALVAVLVHQWTDGQGGLEGYKAWIHSLESGAAGHFGLAYNAAVWAECRKFAVKFLEEAGERIGGGLDSLFERAAEHYAIVARNLKTVSDLYPFSGRLKQEPVETGQNFRAAVSALNRAHDAEVVGLEIFAEIICSLS